MRKNKEHTKNLVKIQKFKGVKVVYSIKGRNLDRFINLLKNKGITLYDTKKIANNRLIATVSFNDSQKFFAIAKEMCYNIKKVKEKGVGYPALMAVRSMGVIVGCCLFALCTLFLNDYIYKISFSGTGSICAREVREYLDSVGVSQFSKFSKIDTQKLEDDILANHKNLSFVSIQKQGNVLMIDLALSKEQTALLDSNIYALYSPVSGVVESIKVYRGTPQVQVGDTVDNGSLLVDGYMVIKEQTVKINVLASVSIIAEQQFIYIDQQDNAEQKALLLAEAHFCDKEVISWSVQKYAQGKEFTYQVSAKYRAVVYAG